MKNDLSMLHPVKLLVLDFDGVMTDNRVLVDENGVEAVWCHRGDGWGLARLRDIGFPALVLSTERNRVVAARCRKLNLECIHGSDDKAARLRQLAEERGLTAAEIAYLGNDVNDRGCLEWAGVPMVVADAVPEVMGLARLVTAARGGHGAVREVADWILSVKTA